MTLIRDQAVDGSREQALRVHPESYLAALEQTSPRDGFARLDSDTTMSPGTLAAAYRAIGGCCQAVDEVMTRKVRQRLRRHAPARPPCRARDAHGLLLLQQRRRGRPPRPRRPWRERVAIMDFDAHHGNGTQDIFWSDERVMYASTHEMPLYPGTGSSGERGEYNNIVNAPLAAGDGGLNFREALEVAILPRLEAFSPDLLIISAGFDAHRRDPLANLNLTEADFAWATAKLMDIADRKCGGRVVSLLEGGYDLDGLARSVAAHVLTLMGT